MFIIKSGFTITEVDYAMTNVLFRILFPPDSFIFEAATGGMEEVSSRDDPDGDTVRMDGRDVVT